MKKGKILVTLPFPPEWLPKIADCVQMAENEGYPVLFASGGDLPEEALSPYLPEICASICSGDFWTEKVLDAAPQLQVLSRMGVGCDRIDIGAATRKGVAVVTTPGMNAPDVAEYTFALMLAATRRICFGNAAVHSGTWPKIFGHSLYGKTLGIVGLGNIGRKLVDLVRGFNMHVLAFDLQKDANYAQESGINYVSLDTLTAQSDIISIHMPLTSDTHGIIGAEAFAHMKRGVIFINCARGGIVDESALLEALDNETVYAAALDVFENEPLPMDSPLRNRDNVLLSPHTAGLTFEGRGQLIEQAFCNALDVLSGKIPKGIVNPEVLKSK